MDKEEIKLMVEDLRAEAEELNAVDLNYRLGEAERAHDTTLSVNLQWREKCQNVN